MSSPLLLAVIAAVGGPVSVALLLRYLDQYTGPAALRRRITEDYALLEKLPEGHEARAFLMGIIDAHVWRYAHTHYVPRVRAQLRPGWATIITFAASIVILGGGYFVFRAKEPDLDSTNLAALQESARRIDQWSDYLFVFLLAVMAATIGAVTIIWWRYLHKLWNPALPLDLPEGLRPADSGEAPEADLEAEQPSREVTDE